MTAGRPAKLTPEIQAKIMEAVRAGAYIETAAAYAGVSKQSLYSWMKMGHDQKRGLYAGFLDAIEKAFADSELRDIMNIGNAAKENWQASAWRLERKFPNKWGRKGRGSVADELIEEEAKLRIEKLKAEIAKINGTSGVDDTADDGFIEALHAEADAIWESEGDGGEE